MDKDVKNAIDDLESVTVKPSSLTVAVAKGDISEVTRLLEAGADPNEADSDGDTPLCFAVQKKHKELVALLLEYGGDGGYVIPPMFPGAEGTPLIKTAESAGETEIAQMLKDAKEGKGKKAAKSSAAGGKKKKPWYKFW